MPPGSTTTGQIEAMTMYAGESVAVIGDIVPVAEIIDRWWPTEASG
jgi:hypothetical protein